MEKSSQSNEEIITAEVVDIMAPEELGFPRAKPTPVPRYTNFRRSFYLFFATCLSTFFVGALPELGTSYSLAIERGLLYAVPLMTILVCHEMGHFLQSYRYGVSATWPYFIPIPLPPIGTMGAVIVMEPRMGHRRALFDIGISGPLAGLVPTIIFCIWGIQRSLEIGVVTGEKISHAPLLFIWFSEWFGREVPTVLDPVAYAGWVGLLITSLNLIPIGQLDGGHILYALLRKKAGYVAAFFLMFAIVGIGYFQLWGWSLMLVLLLLMGPYHPPTANDDEPLGLFRYVLGWLTLAFVIIGFTPDPFPRG